MSKIRIAICQFGQRDTSSFKAMKEHLSEQCDKALNDRPDLVLFPELTTVGLLAMAGKQIRYAGLGTALKEYVASFTPDYEDLFSGLAIKSGAVIVAGSHWTWEESEGKGYNIAYLFFPDGHIEKQRKNHLFPGETDWGTSTFDGLTVFDIGKAKIGVMTCYDSEFPEIGRHFMLAGCTILLCPSATYTERGFYRVRRCCAARAVENQLFVVECHQVGGLSVPVDQAFTAYGRSAVLGPIDEHMGVANGVLLEAESATQETVIVGEVDLDLLELSRESSEATILKDRRPETYKQCYGMFS
jgi:predicted amidohydrolase